MKIENIESDFKYSISLTELELSNLQKELYKVDFTLNPTLKEFYHKLIRA